MKLYQRIINTGLIIAGANGLLGCDLPKNVPQEPRQPVYLTGIVKNERFQSNVLNPDSYIFSVDTEHGLKLFECNGNNSAPTLDVLVNTGDRVKIRLEWHQYIREDTFCISKDQVIEINRKKPPQ